MVKIKTLLPTLKENKRYFLYQVETEGNLKVSTKMIETELRNFIGDLGLAKAGLKFIEMRNNKGILQVNNTYMHEVRAGLALINKIGNNKINIRTLKVSGVLNKIKNAFKEEED